MPSNTTDIGTGRHKRSSHCSFDLSPARGGGSSGSKWVHPGQAAHLKHRKKDKTSVAAGMIICECTWRVGRKSPRLTFMSVFTLHWTKCPSERRNPSQGLWDSHCYSSQSGDKAEINNRSLLPTEMAVQTALKHFTAADTAGVNYCCLERCEHTLTIVYKSHQHCLESLPGALSFGFCSD